MSVESQGQPRRSIPGDGTSMSHDDFALSSEALDRDAQDISESVLRLSSLLRVGPVDLARIGREIRAHPALEALIVRLATSLVVSAGSTSLTVEEAAVALGTDRLRVLIYMWSLPPGRHNSVESPAAKEFENSDAAGDGPSQLSNTLPAWNAEALYLASFLRWLGLDWSGSETRRGEPPCFAADVQSEDIAALTDMLMRDFVALMPALSPGTSKLPQAVAPTAPNGAREKESV